jgi:ABC-type transporter Mla MlaB component
MRLEAVFEKKGVEEVACDVGGIAHADAVAVDALARLQLTARRCGRHVRLRNASCVLRELVAFAGLCDVLPVCSDQRSAMPT